MKFGDFSSLVQLGVGLHLGAALLQQYGDLGLEKVVRVTTRISSMLAEDEKLRPKFSERLKIIEGKIGIFRIRLSQEFNYLRKTNTYVGLLLIAVLIVMSFCSEVDIPVWLGVALTVASVVPAFWSLFFLWKRAKEKLESILTIATRLEDDCLQGSRTEPLQADHAQP